ncbi:hypothetical protein V1517DRAFT_339548 [Lipomyces orientalis]|uniref:Uncharacterized protein n=1 Tax=Lipomyces orientalis TaxID=1233043 RepID=A0ACC3TKK2_9ASCO
MAFPTETANLTVELYNSTSSNFTIFGNATNGTQYNLTETAAAGVTTTSYLATPDGVDGLEHDDTLEYSGDGLEDPKDKLLHILLPLSVFTAIGLLGLAIYLYGSMKKYMKEAISNALASQDSESSYRARNNNRGNDQYADSSESAVQKPPAAHIRNDINPLFDGGLLTDVEKDGFNSSNCSFEEMGYYPHVQQFSNTLARAWRWASAKARDVYNRDHNSE